MAVSLRKPNDEQHEVDQSNPSVPDNLPEYTPDHLIDEGETKQLRSAQYNSDKSAAAKASKDTLVIIIMMVVITVGLFAAMFVLLRGRGAADRSYHADVKTDEAASYISELEQSSTSVIFEPASQSTEVGSETPSGIANGSVSETPDVSEPEQSSMSVNSESAPQSIYSKPHPSIVGSMGSVTILGIEYDIATTYSLYLTGNDITDDEIKQIAKLTKLRTLYLNCNYIGDITPLSELTDLRYLQLQGNHISDISSLSGMTQLKTLSLNANQISDITRCRD